jgi:hypothetical protein
MSIGSAVLSNVPLPVVVEFLNALCRDWLPDKRFELLYRGSRDGMSIASFREKCIDKGPTLTLYKGQSEGHPECVFGGYAGASWGSCGRYVAAADSFVFTVLNPHNHPVTRFPVCSASPHASRAFVDNEGSIAPVIAKAVGSAAGRAASEWGDSFWGKVAGFAASAMETPPPDPSVRVTDSVGPTFGWNGPDMGHTICIRSRSVVAATFDDSSCCGMSHEGTYGDALRLGAATFTGARNWRPLDIEVWRVA